jgi:hypothetical protein
VKVFGTDGLLRIVNQRLAEQSRRGSRIDGRMSEGAAGE